MNTRTRELKTHPTWQPYIDARWGLPNYWYPAVFSDELADGQFMGVQLLGERIQGIRGVTSLFPRLDEGVCPWVYPLRFEGRPKAHLELRAMGIPAIAWDGVRPAGIFPDEFPRADFLYDNLVMLPVHQSLRRRDLELIAESVERVAGAAQLV